MSAVAIERRREPRQKCFLRGLIYFNNRRNVVDCLIRDISDRGARLVFSDAVTTPDVIELSIPQKEQMLRAQTVWRHGQEMGVAITDGVEAQPAAETGDLAARVVQLEKQVAALTLTVRQLKAKDAGEEHLA